MAWFFIGLLFPLLGLILVLVLEDRAAQAQQDARLERSHARGEQRRRHDRQVADQRFAATEMRLAAHDRALGIDTTADFPTQAPPPVPTPPGSGVVRWHYAVGRQPAGPVDTTTLRRLLEHGVVDDDTLVWRKGMSEWQQLGDCDELAALRDVQARREGWSSDA